MGFMARKTNEFNIGRWAVNHIREGLGIFILLKLYDISIVVQVIIFTLVLFLTWLIGYVLKHIGLWDNYVNENLGKGINKNENN